jgi:hypothetical protein
MSISHPQFYTSGTRPGFLGLLVCLLLTTGCGGRDDDAAGLLDGDAAEGWRVQPLTSPAGPGSETPHLAEHHGSLIMSWWAHSDKANGEGMVALRMSEWTDGAWGPVRTVTEGSEFFVNWADFPSVTPLGDGVLAAHWLLKGGQGTYDYSTQIAFSSDHGETWSEPRPLHDDGTPTEHGFVSVAAWPDGGGASAVWLDARKHVLSGDDDGDPATQGPDTHLEMTLRSRAIHPVAEPDRGTERDWSPEVLVDGRTCDCCQTDLAWWETRLPAAPEQTVRTLVAVYRDRTEDEIRDIYFGVEGPDGFGPTQPVADDGWEIAACPVNGPAIDASGSRLAVAWFTGAQQEERVQLAFNATGAPPAADLIWDPPILVDGDTPLGRVDVELLEDGSAAVVWLARTGAGAALMGRRVQPDGTLDPAAELVQTAGARASGFPQLHPAPDGDGFILAWTDVSDDESRIRLARVRIPGHGPAPQTP